MILCDCQPCSEPAFADYRWGSKGFQTKTLCKKHGEELWNKLNHLLQQNIIWLRIDIPGSLSIPCRFCDYKKSCQHCDPHCELRLSYFTDDLCFFNFVPLSLEETLKNLGWKLKTGNPDYWETTSRLVLELTCQRFSIPLPSKEKPCCKINWRKLKDIKTS